MDTSILQPGDFILFQGQAFISRGIRTFSGSKWSHIGIFIGNGYIIESTAAGVEKNLLAPLLKNTSRVAVARIPNLTVENMELMKDKAYAMIGDKYDFWQLITFGIYFAFRKIGIIWSGLIGDKGGSVVCSALCAVCAAVIPVKFARQIKSVTPETIYSSDQVEVIYEEEIRE